MRKHLGIAILFSTVVFATPCSGTHRGPRTLVNAKRATNMLGTSIDVSSGSIVVKNEDGPTYVTFERQSRRPRVVGFR